LECDRRLNLLNFIALWPNFHKIFWFCCELGQKSTLFEYLILPSKWAPLAPFIVDLLQSYPWPCIPQMNGFGLSWQILTTFNYNKPIVIGQPNFCIRLFDILSTSLYGCSLGQRRGIEGVLFALEEYGLEDYYHGHFMKGLSSLNSPHCCLESCIRPCCTSLKCNIALCLRDLCCFLSLLDNYRLRPLASSLQRHDCCFAALD
jgi:hypothetical protein